MSDFGVFEERNVEVGSFLGLCVEPKEGGDLLHREIVAYTK